MREHVTAHIRDGKLISGYTRPAKPKTHKGIHKGPKIKAEIQYYQDDQGRIMPKRKFKVLKSKN